MSGMKLRHITGVTKLVWSSLVLGVLAQEVCTSSSQPNPISLQYSDTPTGTLNATLAIIPIPLDTARQLIPSKYAILEGAYRALLPSFPEGMYPVLMQAGVDHDIQLALYNISVPDFQRTGWSFPFVDLLGDGFSSFTWAPAQMISATVDVAINGARDYGTTVFPASFQPGCDAYDLTPDGSTTFASTATNSDVHFAIRFAPLAPGVANPYPADFYRNVTNQPIFANGAQCDRQIRLFNSTLNQDGFAPVPVQGSIVSNMPPVDFSAGVDGVFGMLIDTPFIEYNGLDCQSLQGYSGTGSED